jgi:hypothetical protein
MEAWSQLNCALQCFWLYDFWPVLHVWYVFVTQDNNSLCSFFPLFFLKGMVRALSWSPCCCCEFKAWHSWYPSRYHCIAHQVVSGMVDYLLWRSPETSYSEIRI